MRTIVWSDIRALAWVLYQDAPNSRSALAASVITQADAADKYRKKFNDWHPRWGNGSLSMAAGRIPRANEPVMNELDFLRCVLIAVAQLEHWMNYKAQLTQPRRTGTLVQSGPVPDV